MEDAKAGDAVRFQGLKGAAHLNGTRGHLKEFLSDLGRWAVRVEETWEIVNAKPTNLTLVTKNSNKVYTITDPTTGQQRQLQPKTNSEPIPRSSVVLNSVEELHETALAAFHQRRKGGVVLSCGDKYMVAIEFDGPVGGGVCGEMVYVDKNPQALAVAGSRGCARAGELGRNFLLGETTEFIETTNEEAFFSLLSRYKRRAKTQGLIDMKSGLKLYSVTISA